MSIGEHDTCPYCGHSNKLISRDDAAVKELAELLKEAHEHVCDLCCPSTGKVMNMTVTKADIAQQIADNCGFLRGEAAEIMDRLLDLIKASLVSGDGVMISGFGKWSVKSKRPRRGRNPQTGEEMMLDGRKVVIWKYSPVLKKAMSRTLLNHGSR